MSIARTAAIVTAWLLADYAAADIYWTVNAATSAGRLGGVYRANDDGTGIERIWRGAFATGIDYHDGVLAWSTFDGRIYRANADGSGAVQVGTIDSGSYVYGLGILGGDVFVATSGIDAASGGAVTRVALDGSFTERIYEGRTGEHLDIDRGSGRVLFSHQSHRINSINPDGSGLTWMSTDEDRSIHGLDVDDLAGTWHYSSVYDVYQFGLSDPYATFPTAINDIAVAESAGLLYSVASGRLYVSNLDGTEREVFANGPDIEQLLYVVPAPGSGVLLALAGLAITRRRR